jgi:DNA-binding beta-propeller fold protein YncE
VGGSPIVFDGVAAKIDIDFSALVYDKLRNKYYASIPATVVGNGNKIATIDPSNGSVSYSTSAVGSNPGAIAMTADGSALYVGVDGTGDIVKLSLPTMTESGRTSLPVGLGALNIAVSPTDPNVVAVALKPLLLNPTVVGVALIRNGVLQPQQANSASDLIAFDPSGLILYGYNNETTEFGLRRIAVLPNGLFELSVVATPLFRFGLSMLSTSAAAKVIQGNSIFQGSDLQLLGSVTAVGAGCIALIDSSKVVCLQDSSSSLLVAESGTFATLATATFAPTGVPGGGVPYKITPGPLGQVALIFRPNFPVTSTSAIWLFNHSSLR